MTDDIVAELERWLKLDMPGDDRGVLRRARNEIVALRELNAKAWAQGFEAAKAVVVATHWGDAIRNQGDEM